MFGISQNEPKITLAQEMSQVQVDSADNEEFTVGKKIKQLAFEPASSRLPASASVSRPWSGIGVPVTQATKRSIGLGSSGIWDNIKRNWKWWLGGSILAIVVIAIVASGGKKE